MYYKLCMVNPKNFLYQDLISYDNISTFEHKFISVELSIKKAKSYFYDGYAKSDGKVYNLENQLVRNIKERVIGYNPEKIELDENGKQIPIKKVKQSEVSHNHNKTFESSILYEDVDILIISKNSEISNSSNKEYKNSLIYNAEKEKIILKLKNFFKS